MAEMPQEDNGDRRRGVRGLVKDLSQQTSMLVRKEIELAKIELAQKLRNMGIGLALLIVAALFALVSFGVLTAAMVAALDLVLQTWAAALIVWAAYVVIAALLAGIGVKMLRRGAPPTPNETIATAKEDVKWLTQRTKSAAR